MMFLTADLADKYDALRPSRKHSGDLHRLILIAIYSFNHPVNWMESAVSEPIYGIPAIELLSSFTMIQ
jgi:hypothetical protein